MIDIILTPDNVSKFTVSATRFNLLFNESNAYDHIVTQLDFGYRVPGTPEHDNCSVWIENQLLTITDTVLVQNFTIQKQNQSIYECQNVLGKLNMNKSNIVIFGAHWDSRNVAEKDVYNRTQPIPGANDGGSGVGVLIELARILSLYKENLDCQVWFLFLDAEDQGYSGGLYGLEGWGWAEGSVKFVNKLDTFYDSSSENIECFILLDMVGGTDLQFIKESRSDEDLHQAIFEEGRKIGYPVAFPLNPSIKTILDDHVAFANKGIAVIDLIIDFSGGNWTYHHTHSDDLSNIDQESLGITGRTIESFVKTYYTLGEITDWRGRNTTSVSYTNLMIIAVFLIGVTIIYAFKRLGRK
jgi:Zn-dependent M28 family amino/carboxypeptidase